MAYDRRDPSPAPVTRVPTARAALFLDLDGTLAALAPTPDQVVPDGGRTALLRRACESLDGRLAVVSGRALGDVDRILEGAAPCAAGVHGLERRGADGSVRAFEPHPDLPRARDSLVFHARSRPGLLVEEKALGVALHYRNAAPEKAAALALAKHIADATGLVLQEGDHVVELRTPGADKGDAVRAFMSEPPFAGSVPLFVGDDLTDEDAFAAVQSMGGAGLLVGRDRPSVATGRLHDVEAVLAWIDRSLISGEFVVETRA